MPILDGAARFDDAANFIREIKAFIITIAAFIILSATGNRLYDRYKRRAKHRSKNVYGQKQQWQDSASKQGQETTMAFLLKTRGWAMESEC